MTAIKPTPKEFADDLEAYWAAMRDLQQMERLLEEARNHLKARKAALYRTHHALAGHSWQVGDRVVCLPLPQGPGTELPEPIYLKPI